MSSISPHARGACRKEIEYVEATVAPSKASCCAPETEFIGVATVRLMTCKWPKDRLLREKSCPDFSCTSIVEDKAS